MQQNKKTRYKSDKTEKNAKKLGKFGNFKLFTDVFIPRA